MYEICLKLTIETLQNRDKVSGNDGELGKIFSTCAHGGILQAFTLQIVRSRLKTCMFRVVVWTKEKCLAKQGKKLFLNFQFVFANQQCFCKFHPFNIKRNINENKNFRELQLQPSKILHKNFIKLFKNNFWFVVLEKWSELQNMTRFSAVKFSEHQC